MELPNLSYIHKLSGGDKDFEQKIAEGALKGSEERWRKAIADTPVPIMIHDETGGIMQISEGWTYFSGYTFEDIPTIADWTEKAYGSRMGPEKEYIDKLFSIKKTVKNVKTDRSQWFD